MNGPPRRAQQGASTAPFEVYEEERGRLSVFEIASPGFSVAVFDFQ